MPVTTGIPLNQTPFITNFNLDYSTKDFIYLLITIDFILFKILKIYHFLNLDLSHLYLN